MDPMDQTMDSVGRDVAVEQQVIDRIDHLTTTPSPVGRYDRIFFVINKVALTYFLWLLISLTHFHTLP